MIWGNNFYEHPMNKTSDKLFVYGTLMRVAAHPAAEYLKTHGTYLDRGSFRGELFEIEKYPGAVYTPRGAYHVHGEIFLLDSPDDVLAYLDPYEETGPGFPEPHEYIRTVIPVHPEDTAVPVSCWVYLYNRDTSGRQQIMHGNYKRFMLGF